MVKKVWQRGGLAAAAAMLAVSCSATTPGGEPLAAAHPMRADKLQVAMRGFDAAVRSSVPAETDEYDRWEGVYPAMADAAAELKVSARQLAGEPPAGLELPDRGRFQMLGRSLADAAESLEQAAARGDADAVALARGQVAFACRDCHARFRPDSPGVPDAFR